MTNSNLGKGLGELLGSSLSDLDDKKEKVKDIKITLVEPGKYQPRLTIDEEELKLLTKSIKEKGVIQPILVKFNNIIHKYEIIAGERRFRASVAAGKTSIPAIMLDVNDKEAYELAIIENIQRERLNPLEEAVAIDKLVKKYNYSQDDVAKKLGKSRTHIANIARLLSLPDEIQNMVSQNELSMGHARALINKENAIELAKKIIDENLSVREVERLVKAEANKNSKKAVIQHDKQKKLFLNTIAKKLTSAINYNVKIKHNGKKGELVVEFKTIDDLSVLSDFIEKNVSRET